MNPNALDKENLHTAAFELRSMLEKAKAAAANSQVYLTEDEVTLISSSGSVASLSTIFPFTMERGGKRWDQLTAEERRTHLSGLLLTLPLAPGITAIV